MKKTFVIFASLSFSSRFEVCSHSVKKHMPNWSIHRTVPDDSNVTGSYIPWMAKRRLETALELLEKGYSKVIIMGADCVLYSPMKELEDALDTKDCVMVPHVVNPVSRHMMAEIYKSGHANADLIGFRNSENAKDILKWLISVTRNECHENGIFYEQTWLSSVPFVFPNTLILRHPGYNFGYWDANDRVLNDINGVWYVGHERLVMVQFSGYLKGKPEIMSKYSRQGAIGKVLHLYKEYDNLIEE